ncbi:MAG: phosphotransferase [Alphaproteobacteria bacterium]
MTIEIPRETIIRGFLLKSGWGGAALEPLAGDASTRRYIRLRRDSGATALLMDAPPRAESAACPPDADEAMRQKLGYNAVARLAGPDSRRFAAFSQALAARGLAPPDILDADYDQGLMVLEDLGDDLYARAIAGGTPELPLYEAAVDVLLALHATQAPPALGVVEPRVPLLAYDALAYKAEVDLLVEWLYPLLKGTALPSDLRAEWNALWQKALAAIRINTHVIVLRDYHAENLFWLPERHGLHRVGLIDFQDGLSGSPAYDLVSLLEDARRDVDPALASVMLQHYIKGAGIRDRHFDAEGFGSDFALLGAQRNAKILGIFARLWRRDKKPGYLKLIPRVWRYIERDLEAPGISDLKAWFDTNLPAELRIAPEPK